MKGKTPKRKPLKSDKGKRFLKNQDPFFKPESKRQRKVEESDEDDGGLSDEWDEFFDGDDNGGARLVGDREREEEEDEFEQETKDEKRRRLAMEHLQKLRAIEREQKEEEDEDEGEERGRGGRDSLVAEMLQQQQLEDSGRARRFIASKVQRPETTETSRVLVKHQQSVTAVALSDDDLKGFSASKDGKIVHWDVEIGKSEKYLWPTNKDLKSHGFKDPQGRGTKHSKVVLALAVSSDGRYLATGGLDRHIHLWDTRTREHIQAFPGHRGAISCLSFRQGSTELFSGSFDRTVKIWNVEDRAYITTLFGHQSEVLTIDCLRKERALTVARDRTMHLWKVPEESQLIFRAPASSLECCCFVSNDEFLSGSDDGSIELWSVLRKKPVSIVRNAHALLPTEKKLEPEDAERIPNGHTEDNGLKTNSPCSTAESWVSAVTVCRNSDLAASGAGNGCVRLWAIESDNRRLQPLFDLPMRGYVNSLAFAKSARFLVAGIGQEPRLGRWGYIRTATNGVVLQSLKLS